MSSKQIATEFFKIVDNYEGQAKAELKEAFDTAFLEAQHKETEYAYAHSGNGHAYCAN